MTKVFVFGLDGATFDYMMPWIESGHLPTMEKLLSHGTSGTLQSTFLPTTAMAWPSMLTGKNAGKHGIFDFRQREDDSYDLLPSITRNIDGDPLHHYLSRRGLRVGMVNVPMTYPPAPVNGMLISGFTTPRDAETWCFPDSLPNELDAAGTPYPMHLLHDLVHMKRQHRGQGKIDQYIRSWGTFTNAQAEAVCQLLERDPYDFFMIVFSSTDHINHHTPEVDHIRRIYEQVDRAMGRILKELDDETTVLVVSDHGSAPLEQYIVLNRFLEDHNLIEFRPEIAAHFVKLLASRLVWRYRSEAAQLWRRLPQGLRQLISWPLLQYDERLRYGYDNIDWQRTRAYANSGIGTLFVNLKGREPQGIVAPGDEYEAIRDQLIDGLLSLRNPKTNKPLIDEALRAEEVFHGPHMDSAPDVVFTRRNPRHRAVTGFGSDPVFRPSRRDDGTSVEYGYHTREGILIATGPRLKAGSHIEGADIHDIAPTVLHILGLPVPTDMDGKVLLDLFDRPQSVTYTEPDEKTHSTAEHNLSRKGQLDIEERLRALGYLE